MKTMEIQYNIYIYIYIYKSYIIIYKKFRLHKDVFSSFVVEGNGENERPDDYLSILLVTERTISGHGQDGGTRNRVSIS